MRRGLITILVFHCAFLLSGCVGESSFPTVLKIPTAPGNLVSVVLAPPTYEQQVQQEIGTKICGPAVAVTLYRMILGADYSLVQAEREMLGPGGTLQSDLAGWFVSHGVDASLTIVSTSGIYDFILSAIKDGYYVVPAVYPFGVRSTMHFLIIYGVNNGMIMISDSAKRSDLNLLNQYSIHSSLFESLWIVRLPTTDVRQPNGNTTMLILVNSRRPKQALRAQPALAIENEPRAE